MPGIAYCRAFLYAGLSYSLRSSQFACSVVLLGLTGWHIHHTETLKVGDALSSRIGPFYVPTIVELLVASCLGILFSLWFLVAILARIGNGALSFGLEMAALSSVWVMWIVGAAIISNKWPDLDWCRHTDLVCRMVDAIVAFSWLNWAIATFLLVTAFADFGAAKESFSHRKGPQTTQTATAAPVSASAA
ncbi:hypothetical protein CPB83DRAFT_837547 [Crepidotus variabilis]|uniref:MARVEL domain-containing protein n=1 Tax=Crepidotus variabilis TaxID=179855 RepID=A0A9P6EC12_9AGAR|nr:hypothetical protein CPB83DRAFT_837547 [Crepidotus variabilis]